MLDAATCILADYQRGPEFDTLLSVIPAAFFPALQTVKALTWRECRGGWAPATNPAPPGTPMTPCGPI